LAAGFCLKNLAFARKIMDLPDSGGLQLPAPGLYTYDSCNTQNIIRPVSLSVIIREQSIF